MLYFTMANFYEMAMLFAINNVNLHEELINNDNVRQIRKKATISDPFILSDQLYVKIFKLTKALVRHLIELLRPLIISKSRLSAIDLNTKVNNNNE
jgi:hypothetical protein